MVFTSHPIYLDPPNWNHQPNHQMSITLPSNNNELTISPSSMITSNRQSQHQNPNPNPNPRTGSMSERARLAKIPQPEAALNCPRCDSTNTKFCYFNNYSLSQPRHFCKACRRYWTRGGTLRSVPVGGGCRRNKKSSKKLQGGSGTNSSSNSKSSCSGTTAMTTSGNTATPSNLVAANLQLNFLSSLHPFGDPGLNFTTMTQPMDGSGDYQMGMQQYPFLGGINYADFNGEGSTSGGGGELGLGFHLPTKVTGSSGNISSGLITQMASVKMEDGIRNNDLSRQYLGMASGNDQYLGGGWVGDLSGFNSSSTGNML